MTSRRTWFTRMAAALGLSPLATAELTKPHPIPHPIPLKVSSLLISGQVGGSYTASGSLGSGSCAMHARLSPEEFGISCGYVLFRDTLHMRKGKVTACLDDGSLMELSMDQFGQWHFPYGLRMKKA